MARGAKRWCFPTSCPSVQASHCLRDKHHVGRGGSWRPSWAPTPSLPGPLRLCLPAAGLGTKSSLCFRFCSEAGGDCSEGGAAAPWPLGLHTGNILSQRQRVSDILSQRQGGGSPAARHLQLICASRGPALSLIVESSSVTKKGPESAPARDTFYLTGFPLHPHPSSTKLKRPVLMKQLPGLPKSLPVPLTSLSAP